MSCAAAAPGSRVAPRYLTASVPLELGVLFALSVLIPFALHLVPAPPSARLGQRLLPVFFAPLLAALFGRPGSSFLVALAAPWLNYAVTGYPLPRSALLMTIELGVFVGMLQWLGSRFGRAWFLALPAFATCMLVAASLGAFLPQLLGGAAALAWLQRNALLAPPGVGAMLLITWLANRFYPASTETPTAP